MSRSSPTTGAKSSGFTLLELLVVLVLAAITVTVVGGGAQAFMDRARYHQAIRNISGQLSQARALCIQEGKTVVVAYQPETRQLTIDGRFRVDVPASLAVAWDPVERAAKADPVLGQPIFVFNAEGGARGGRFSVSREGQGVVFRVNWLLGTLEQAALVAGS